MKSCYQIRIGFIVDREERSDYDLVKAGDTLRHQLLGHSQFLHVIENDLGSSRQVCEEFEDRYSKDQVPSRNLWLSDAPSILGAVRETIDLISYH